MEQKEDKPTQTNDVKVRNMPISLWKRMHKFLKKTGRYKYTFIAEAISEKLDREESKEREK
jgi:predicted DNA-binding protein